MSRAFRLGAFIVASLLLFGAGVFWIGSREFIFSSTYRLNAEFQNVAGLSEGAAVRVGGIHEGTVRHVILPTRSDQKVRVEMDMKGPTRNVIRKDSLAAIHSEGLVGDQYVEIGFGSPQAPAVSSGDTIGTEPPLQISDLIKKTNGILDEAQGALKGVSVTAGNLEAISGKINEGKGSVGALINDRSIYQHFNEAASNLAEDTEALKHNFLTRGFFKKRGYEDEAELTRYAVANLPSGAPAQRLSWPASKLFDGADNSKLKKGKLLDDAGRSLEQGRFGLAVVVAYADRTGDSDKQKELTAARATAVREYLVQHFKLDDTRVKTIGLGKSGEDVPDGGQVELLVYSGGTPIVARKK